MQSRIITISFLLLSFAFLFSLETSASPVNSRMDEANKFYREGNYENAIEIYQSLINEGYLGVSLFYNTGNSFYRIGNIGKAILFYAI